MGLGRASWRRRRVMFPQRVASSVAECCLNSEPLGGTGRGARGDEPLGSDSASVEIRETMMRRLRFGLTCVALLALVACGKKSPVEPSDASPTPAPTTPTPAPTTPTPARLAVAMTWQWQLTTPVDLSVDAEFYDLDLFGNTAATVAALHSLGRYVVCYISVGSWEDFRADASDFPAGVIGNPYEGYPDERWLDIRQIDQLAPLLRKRFDECADKGFDGIEPDNIDGYQNDTGFPIGADDQLLFNRWLATEAHMRVLSIGLKNDPEQVGPLMADFDWALTEDCFADGFCNMLAPMVSAGKPVFAAEYTDRWSSPAFCDEANRLNFNAILKNRALDSFRVACR